jgi:ferredoxin
MNAKVDQTLCIGCGACTAMCPKSFRMVDEIGKAEAIAAEDDITCAQSAAEGCPVQAISVA